MHQPAGLGVALPLLLLLLLTIVVPGSLSCPRSCNCYQASEVHCTFRSLLTVPPGLPSHTRRINLGFNSINRIHGSSFAGLKRAELLMLHSNALQQLPDAAFADMKSLQILKLSYNKLRAISSSLTFSGLTSLLRLYLDHNLLEYIHPRALLQLPGLRLLRLQGNRLHQLHPHTLCTVSLLNTYHFSTLRHLDLSNNSLTTLAKDTLATAPQLETLMLQANPWSCDCRMNWLHTWSLAHPGLMKCPAGPQCPTCTSPNSLQGQGLLDQMDLSCTSPSIAFPERNTPLETELSEIQSRETFREPLGSAFLGLSDQQGNNVDLSCNITLFSDSQDITHPPDLSLSSSSPIPLTLSLSLECPVERDSYGALWRILAYYSETAVRLEREIMLSKDPELAYRYRQVAETDGYYHTGVKAAVKAKPHWLLQPAISIQLNRAQSNGQKVNLMYSTRVSAPLDPTPGSSASATHFQPWVLILTNNTRTAVTAVSGSLVDLPCSLRSSGNPKVQWILPDGSKLISPSSSLDGRIQATVTGLILQKSQLSDAGLYYCVAQAGKDVDVLPLRLAVEESSVPPSGEQLGPPVIGIVGESISLPCNASGSPEPYLSWVLPDGNILWSGLAVSRGLSVQPNGSLSLPNLSLRDIGHYRCIAVNSYGSDSLSIQLEFKTKHSPALTVSFPRGPQSAAGRSTRIRAPLFDQILEGSGDEVVEEEQTSFGNRNSPRAPQRPPLTHYPNGIPRRRVPVKEGLQRRGGGRLSSTNQRRNHFNTRHRVATNKQRIDPQKWADLLAKIRQKTAHSQPITTAEPTTKSVGVNRVSDTTSRGEDVDSTADKAGTDADIEGSAVEDNVLQEEDLQPVHPVFTDIQTVTEAKAEDGEREASRQTQTYIETETHTQIPNIDVQTETSTKKELVTSRPILSNNEIIHKPAEGFDQRTNLHSHQTRPQRPRKRPLPNLVPNIRPQSPWNTHRRIGQQRRIINRPRLRPVTPPRPLPDPTQQRSQTPTPDTTTYQSNRLWVTTTSPSAFLTRADHVKSISSHSVNPMSPHISYNPGASDSESLSRSLASTATPVTSLSPSRINPHADVMTHSAKILETAESTLFSTVSQAASGSHVVILQTHEPDTHGTQAPHTTLGKHAHELSSEDRERNFLEVSYELNSNSRSSTTSSTTARTTILTNHRHYPFTSSARRTTSAANSKAIEDTIPTTSTHIVTANPITSNTANTVNPLSKSSTSPAPIPPSSATTTSTTTTSAPTSTMTTAAIRFKNPIKTPPATQKYSPSMTPIPTTRTTVTISTKASSTTSTSTTTTTTMRPTSTRASFRERPSLGRVDTQGRPVSGALSPSRSLDWRNPGANLIPDSHRTRPHWSPSLPAVPGPSVLRSRPRIADPHIRTVSNPAESTAMLACEAQGEPKPSITWTKVATGAVMSVHSKANRFEVMPNGTLVIQNVQLQDRGTYICSAQSFLGRDRLLTTLEVWTRPPRMQLASYREVTIHQGGEVHLECRADGVPAPLLSWVLPDRSVLTSSAPSSSHVFMDTNGTLHNLGTLPVDRGVYRCVASNSAGAASSSVRVHVSSLPPVIQQSREEHLLLSLGRPLYAHCSARGAPPPTLRWRIPDGTLVRPSQFLHGNLFVLPNGTLHIRRIEQKDSGSYECLASNAVGADKRTVSVKIEREAAGQRREGGTQNEGTEAVANENSPSLYSLNNDRSLQKPGHARNVFSTAKLSPPLFTDRAKALPVTPSTSSHPHSPKLTYSPPQSNKTGIASTTHLTNIDKTKTSFAHINKHTPSSVNNTKNPSFPQPERSRASHTSYSVPISPFSKAQIISTSPSITTVHYGGILQLHCTVTGSPPPIIIWRTPIRKLVDMHFSFDHRLKVHPNGTLSVQAVTEKDAGDYLCIARNKVADDYRLLRVSVATKPAKIEPKHPLDQMVSLGKPLKVDCQASGLPDPAVHWSLPDGTMVNSVLQGEDRGGRSRRLTVFDNGTLLVPAVGMREEGEYTCYAENQGGQDTMKVKVKVMMPSPPTLMDGKPYHIIKVHQGTTAVLRCKATGDPVPTVTWLSPASRVIPRSLGSGHYSERVVVVSDGTLEVRQAQNIDTGNYTCRVSNSAGERSIVVSLEVEPFNHMISGQAGGRSPNINHEGIAQYGASSKLGTKNIINSDKNSNTEPHIGINAATSGSNPAFRTDQRNGFNRPVGGITTQFESSVSSDGVSGARNTFTKADNVGSRNGHSIASSFSNSVVNSRSTARGDNVESNSGRNYNEVNAGRATNDDNTSRDNGRISGAFRNVGISSSVAGIGTLIGNWQHRSGHTDINKDYLTKSNITAGSNSGPKNLDGTTTGVAVKQRVVKGSTVLLPCPSQGSPPPRLTWLLPGNGVLPAPYYGSRLTVHRNGTLEIRGVRATDGGTLFCVVRGERGETRTQVELEISEPQEAARSPHREPTVERRVQKTTGLTEIHQSGASLDSIPSLRSVLPDKPRPRLLPVTPQRSSALPSAPRPLGPPLHSAGPVSESAVSTRTASLVSIINGETLRLPCPSLQTPGHTQRSLSWNMPSGKVLSRGESIDSGRYLVQEDGTLIVKQASVFDRGAYTCKSTSHNSSVSLLTIPVIVIAYPPRITTGPAPVTYTRPGVAVELPCLTIAIPRATVTWETPDLVQLRAMGQVRIYGNRHLSPQGSLVIQNPTSRDTGFYRCTATNVIGVDTKATYLHVI